MQNSAPDETFNISGQSSPPPALTNPPTPLSQPLVSSFTQSQPSIDMKPPKKRNRPGGILFFLIFLLILVAGGGVAATVYAKVDLPFVSVSQRLGIVIFLAKVPLLPRTAEQVVLTAYEANKQLKTYWIKNRNKPPTPLKFLKYFHYRN